MAENHEARTCGQCEHYRQIHERPIWAHCLAPLPHWIIVEASVEIIIPERNADDCECFSPHKKVPMPPPTQEPILRVDLTPDADLPLRILRAYRAGCDLKWSTDAYGQVQNELTATINEHQRMRAAILDAAIDWLG